MKVKELSVEQLKALIQEAVEEKLQEILGDPDQGLELKEYIKERLRRSLAAIECGEEGIPHRSPQRHLQGEVNEQRRLPSASQRKRRSGCEI